MYIAHTKQAVIDRLINNRAVDPQGTGAIFHFSLTNHIQNAREDFLQNAIWVMGTTVRKCLCCCK
jgi:hypothetical protein